MTSLNYPSQNSLAIALGANLPSKAGSPISTLIKVKPQIEEVVCKWMKSSFKDCADISSIFSSLNWQWSPLYKTEPLGGPLNQPAYVNAVVLITGYKLMEIKPSESAALNLLKELLKIEKFFGRDRDLSKEKWGPRTLDIDILAWGGLHINTQDLTLPHPRLIERDFVVIPLAAAMRKNNKSVKDIPNQKGWAK